MPPRIRASRLRGRIEKLLQLVAPCGERAVREVERPYPVDCGDSVLSAAPYVAKRLANKRCVVVLRKFSFGEALPAEEFPHRGSSPCSKILSLRIKPSRVEALYEQSARRNCRDQHMLVEFHRLLVVHVFRVGLAVPVRKRLHLRRDVLSEVSFGERTSAAASLVGDADGKPVVACRRKKRRLCKPRRASDDVAPRVDFGYASREVKTARKRPCPRAKRRRVVVAAFVALRPQFEDARVGEFLWVASRNFHVRRDLRVAGREKRIATRRDYVCQYDGACPGAAHRAVFRLLGRGLA